MRAVLRIRSPRLWGPTVLGALSMVGCVHHALPRGAFSVHHLEASRADEVLVPGDFLFRYVDPADPLDAQVTNAIIEGGQEMVQSSSDGVQLTEQALRDVLGDEHNRFEGSLVEGDPNAVHMAVYLGGGETAEAFGTSADDARVAVWSLFADYRRGSAWRVLRHVDPRVRSATAAVARRWATGRMGYQPPFDVFVQGAAWGEHGRETALEFADAFTRDGGPPSFGSMFCSQFAVAALQSASANVYLADDEHVWSAPDFDRLPRESRIDAIASPLRVYGEWLRSGAFKVVAHIVIR